MDDPHLHPQSTVRNVVRFLPALIWATAVIVMSLAPGNAVGRLSFLNLPYADKLAHFGFYLVLAVLTLHGFAGLPVSWVRKATALTIVTGVILGVMLEFLQHSLGALRHFEVLDIIANIIGTLCGSALFKVLLKRKYYGS